MPTTPCHLLVDPPKPGAWNMAADEILLEEANRSKIATLRFYRWLEPTLSLGYFQEIAQRTNHPPSRELTVVRRLSGGGAIVHDHELTYSLVLPASQPIDQNHKNLYSLVHQALIETLLEFGIHAWSHCPEADGNSLPESSPAGSFTEAPFLCFQRHCPGDVLISDRNGQPAKILGSAQRRRRGALLQHGSLLLAASRSAPELAGLDELAPTESWSPLRCGNSGLPDNSKLIKSWCTHLQANLKLDLRLTHWSPEQLQRIEQHQQTRYCHANWTEAREYSR